MRKAKLVLLLLALVLAVLMTATIGTYGWYRLNHVKVNGEIYDRHATHLDLRGEDVSEAEYLQLCQALPDTKVIWDVPFQGNRYPEDTQQLVITEISDADMLMLDYLPGLTYIDATECRDYGMIDKLREKLPGCQIDFYIHLGSEKLEEHTESLKIKKGQVTSQELQDAISHLPSLKMLSFDDPDIPFADIEAIQTQYPELKISWEKPILGKTYPLDTKELDLSNVQVSNLKEVEQAVSYYPDLKKLIMVDCGVKNEDMAAFRERARDRFQVVWGVQVGQAYLRTDQTGFVPSNHNQRVKNEDTENLKYCEGLLAVDFGHIGVTELSWVSGTPHLKYLILGDGNVKNEDIQHLAQLQELVYLEIFMTPVTDISPLVNCKALEDLNLSRSYVDVKPLGKMPWLKNLWMQGNDLSTAEKEYLTEKLPNTHIDWVHYNTCHGRGWRQLPNYYAMRDTLGMWYMKE